MAFVEMFLLPALAGILTWLLTSKDWSKSARVLTSIGVLVVAFTVSRIASADSVVGTWEGTTETRDMITHYEFQLRPDHTYVKLNAWVQARPGLTVGQKELDSEYNLASEEAEGNWSFDSQTSSLLLSNNDFGRFVGSYNVHRFLWIVTADRPISHDEADLEVLQSASHVYPRKLKLK